MNGDIALIDMLTPQPGEDPKVFLGRSHAYGAMGIYGGHFLGQALAAGLTTVAEPKLAHSLHAYFMRGGDPEVPIRYTVDSLRDGRGSSTRSISAWQHDAEVFRMMASFKVPEDGDEHQPTPPAVMSAEALVEAREARGEEKFPFPPAQNGWTQMEWISPSFREFDATRDPQLRLWMRVPAAELLDARQRQIVLAFLSDATIMFNSIVPYGVIMETHRATSLDHSVWFHRKSDPAQWMLYDQRSTAAGDGRGMNFGEIYGADGALLLSCAQESMLRRVPSETQKR